MVVRRDGARLQRYIYNVNVGNDARWLGEDRIAKNNAPRNGKKKRGKKMDGLGSREK